MDHLAQLIAQAMPEVKDRGRFDLDTAFARECVRDEIRQLEAAIRQLHMARELLPRDATDHAGSILDVIGDIRHDMSIRQTRVDAALAKAGAR